MQRFKNILVGVDLSSGHRMVWDELAAPTREAIERAMWLAKLNGARVCFLTALPLPQRAQRELHRWDNLERTIVDEANGVLGQLVQQAEQQGIQAVARVTIGPSWLELTRQVLREQHDLLIVGTRHLGHVAGMLIGSTGMKLLRKCPCPVWVTQPQPHPQTERIMVATDFSAVCDVALDLGASMAALTQAELHVLHVAHYIAEPYLLKANVPAEDMHKYYHETREAAEKELEQQLQRPSVAELPGKPYRHVLAGDPGEVIREQLEEQEIDLLVMGTIARGGISGMWVGNTAERLLPAISCSLLAVKPEDFRSPVTLDEGA